MNLLFIGDIVGKGGRKAVKELVPELRRAHACSFCVANGENMADGSGANEKCVADITGPVDVVTLGDHAWGQKAFETEIGNIKNVLRPANVSPAQPGRGFGVFKIPGTSQQVAVVNLMGRVFMKDGASCPFAEAERILAQIPPEVKSIFVDFHAEASSEKLALSRFLDGKVTAVVGTHTHVQTADATVLPGGSAYITDMGMVGADESILGRDISCVIRKFTTGMPVRLEVVEKGSIRLDAVVISFDETSGKASAIKPLSLKITV